MPKKRRQARYTGEFKFTWNPFAHESPRIEDSYKLSVDERSMLKGKKMKFIYDPNTLNSIVLGIYLTNELKSIGVQLTLHPVSFPTVQMVFVYLLRLAWKSLGVKRSQIIP